MKRKKIVLLVLLSLLYTALSAACTPSQTATAESAKITAAVRGYVNDHLGLSDEFTVEVEAVDGDYARTTVHSIQPQGGFTAYVKRDSQSGTWTTLLVGSGINPDELKSLEVPQSIIP